ncbi:MAG: hypothetical protein COX19_02285 [Desulfobacterales bacterium CG23_combo_of_CG06-09_8_20_14_all_51_8]|nr:MAG: hypothetical protein COX19_02285 [Desulfobacterales bacterium CG23_combo_of_CG06-09_8_20_14_all_51_8]
MSIKENERDVRDYLNDILEMIEDINKFIEGMSYENLVNDKKTLYAVIRCLEVVGEAVKKIPNSIRDEHSEMPWREIAGMRNKLTHEYFGIDIETIWDTIKEDLPALKEAVSRIITG